VILASIYIGPPGRGEDLALPPLVQENIASLKRHHPGLPHRLFSGEDIGAFLEEKFPREVLNAYNALRPNAYKADLARYCIIHELGGIYADLSFVILRPLPLRDGRPVVFRDLIFSAPWDTSNSLIASPARHKALERAIEMVCANVKSGYYGSTNLCPTGPALFGKALAETCNPEELITGISVATLREQLGKEFPGLALPDAPRAHCLRFGRKVVIAIKRKRIGVSGLGSLGIAGSDDYAALWNDRAVYEGDAAQG
jgi:hypothetical protein